MKNGICPKYGSNEVFFLEGKTHRSTLEHSGWGSLTNTTDYACANCGYVEEYLRSGEDRDKVREGWQRVVRKSQAG